jgi:hypothetical protein
VTGLLAEAYAELVERVRDLVDRYVPQGSTVAVVSRGDPALLELGETVGWHVPGAEDGRYVGYHPADTQDAIGTVESVRARGAEFLLVPDTSSWWLSHYEGLREHLERLGPPLAEEPGTATLFALSGPRSVLEREATERIRVIEDLEDLVALLLPPRTALTIVDGGQALRGRFARWQVTSVDADAMSAQDLASASCLVIPNWHYRWLSDRGDVRDELDRRGRLVTWQEHVGAIYELALVGEGS